MSSPFYPKKQGLYDPDFEHDSCGVGFIVHMKGKKSHDIIRSGIQILENLIKSCFVLKQSILKQAFEGKLIPQDPNDEPAEILLQKIKQEKEQLKQKEKSKKRNE